METRNLTLLTDLYEQRELTNTIYNEDYAKKFKENNILIHYGELCGCIKQI